MRFLTQMIGVGLIIVALVDIYLTVLFPRLGSSIISLRLTKGMWRLFWLAAYLIPGKDKKLLSHSGPILIVITITVWICLLVCGFALIVWTSLGASIRSTRGMTETDFITALYYSGFSLTTLGTGDFTPETNTQRLLMVLEAAVGFSIFTLTITYLLSIYSALIRRNTFALSLHHRTAGTADAAEMIARLESDGSLCASFQQDISNIARDLINLLESQNSYPALLYFRFQQTYYALPRILLLSMDTATLIKTALHKEKYRSVINSTAVAELWGGGLQLLVELSNEVLPKSRSNNSDMIEQVWRKRYYHAVEKFRAEGIETVTDLEAGASKYISLRRKWNPSLARLAKYMAYNWSEIAPHESYNR